MKVLTIVGARPQFVKAAVVSRAFLAHGGVNEVLVHTGQHFDANMSDIFFEEMNIPRAHHMLEIHGGRHGEMTGRMIKALEPVMLAENPDLVLIYGDTNSTIAGALDAAKLCIPVAHVEAGLRSFDRKMPEEINRVVADHLSDLLFAPTRTAVHNLEAEGLTKGVHLVGDVMYDSTLLLIDIARRTSTIVTDLGLKRGDYAVATIHRQSTTDAPEALKAAVDYLSARASERAVVLPLHPRTKAAADKMGISFEKLIVIDPVGPADMHALLDGCAEVYTDSGGLQKEAYFHQKPCITLRDTTEWVETIESGWNRLWTKPDYVVPRRKIEDYGSGDASEKIVDVIINRN